MNEVWYPQNYSPNLSVEDWKKLLQDKEIFSTSDLEIVKRFWDFGENGIFKATYSQLAYTYGENYHFYQKNIDELGKRIFSRTRCEIVGNNFRNILLKEREAGDFAKNHNSKKIIYHGEDYTKIYKLRDELADALFEVDLSEIKLYSDEKISRPIDFSSKEKIKSLRLLGFVVLDSNRKIPIKTWIDETDYRGYYMLLNKSDGNLKITLEEMGYKNRDSRLTDDVATKLLAKGFAYKISRKDFDEIEAQFKKGNRKFSPITSDEYEN